MHVHTILKFHSRSLRFMVGRTQFLHLLLLRNRCYFFWQLVEYVC